ncbi:MAG: ribonuclease R [Thiomargarita sp.]|nr:ribonuclease R [Thiomargarita sp.]
MNQPKKKSKLDPFAKREANNYRNPIPSREFIIQQLDGINKPISSIEIAELLNITEKEQIQAVRRRLKAMVRDNQLVRSRRKYKIAGEMQLVRGQVMGHPDGYGFLIAEDGKGDLFLSQREMRQLIHGDHIIANITGIDNKGRREGVVVKVLEHQSPEIVGQFFHKQGQNVAYIKPNNKRITHKILIEGRKNQGKAKDGQMVVIRLLSSPTLHKQAFGKVVEIIGNNQAPGMEIDIAIRSHDLPHKWSKEVLQETTKFAPEISKAMLENREDMRDIPFVTIDGEDSRDFDDAVYCEPRGKGWRLLIAIADVAAYVEAGSEIDLEAQERGNSVYFPNRVVPMLPEILSNTLCSLKPNVDRLSIVCELAIDFYGRTRRTRFFEAVIRSSARLTYTAVAKVLAGNKRQFKHRHLLSHINHLQQLYQLLLKRRKNRGAIDFDTVEARFVFDKQKKIKEIVPQLRNDAHRLIEEMMLAANIATAEWLAERKMPLLYRIHEPPTTKKVVALRDFLKGLGLILWGREKPETHHYSSLLEKVRDRPDYNLVQTVMLRSLQLAIYHTENQGHFGLAYPAYTHFTSPIRRYSDLLVHRAIRHCLQAKTAETFDYSLGEMGLLAEQCTASERQAEDATRDVISWLKCQYMQDKITQEFDGIITSVTGFGFFVELRDIFIDGLVHISSLKGDNYHFDHIHHRLLASNSGKSYRLSDQVRVKVVRVDLEEKKIDFDLVS